MISGDTSVALMGGEGTLGVSRVSRLSGAEWRVLGGGLRDVEG